MVTSKFVGMGGPTARMSAKEKGLVRRYMRRLRGAGIRKNDE
jgi:hypothetical protein